MLADRRTVNDEEKRTMDPDKLRRLRARYADRDAFDGDDPVLTKAAHEVQSPTGRRSLPYSGVPTFLGLPHAETAAGLDVAIVGVPMDLGVSNRAGARFGPRAVRTIERIGPYHPTFRGVPKSRVRAADVGDVPFRSRYNLEQSLEDIEHYFTALKAQGIRPLAVGGDHSITYPILKALGKDAPLGLVHIDAHCDTMGAYDGSKFHHGGPFRLAVLDGVVDRHPRIVQHVLGVFARLGHDGHLHGGLHENGCTGCNRQGARGGR
jgi:guanidinopropionase